MRPVLIDGYDLHVHPVAISAGKPLFTQQTSLKLVSARTYDCGVMQRIHSPGRWCPLVEYFMTMLGSSAGWR